MLIVLKIDLIKMH